MSSNASIPAANGRKPNPSEPWRYVCPYCGGQVSGRADSMKFLCSTCRRSWYKNELVDQRRETVTPIPIQ